MRRNRRRIKENIDKNLLVVPDQYNPFSTIERILFAIIFLIVFMLLGAVFYLGANKEPRQLTPIEKCK